MLSRKRLLTYLALSGLAFLAWGATLVQAATDQPALCDLQTISTLVWQGDAPETVQGGSQDIKIIPVVDPHTCRCGSHVVTQTCRTNPQNICSHVECDPCPTPPPLPPSGGWDPYQGKMRQIFGGI